MKELIVSVTPDRSVKHSSLQRYEDLPSIPRATSHSAQKADLFPSLWTSSADGEKPLAPIIQEHLPLENLGTLERRSGRATGSPPKPKPWFSSSVDSHASDSSTSTLPRALPSYAIPRAEALQSSRAPWAPGVVRSRSFKEPSHLRFIDDESTGDTSVVVDAAPPKPSRSYADDLAPPKPPRLGERFFRNGMQQSKSLFDRRKETDINNNDASTYAVSVPPADNVDSSYGGLQVTPLTSGNRQPASKTSENGLRVGTLERFRTVGNAAMDVPVGRVKPSNFSLAADGTASENCGPPAHSALREWHSSAASATNPTVTSALALHRRTNAEYAGAEPQPPSSKPTAVSTNGATGPVHADSRNNSVMAINRFSAHSNSNPSFGAAAAWSSVLSQQAASAASEQGSNRSELNTSSESSVEPWATTDDIDDLLGCVCQTNFTKFKLRRSRELYYTECSLTSRL